MLVYVFRLCGLLLLLLIHLSGYAKLPSAYRQGKNTWKCKSRHWGKEKEFLKTMTHFRATPWLAIQQT